MDLKASEDQQAGESEDPLDKLATKEAMDLIMEKLPPSMRNNFFRIANGVSVQSAKKNALFSKIKEILGEDWQTF
jgi:hypothetical protein